MVRSDVLSQGKISDILIRCARAVCFVLLSSCFHVAVKYSVSLDLGAVGWTVVCDCGISVPNTSRRRLSYPSVSRSYNSKFFHPSTLLQSSSLLLLILCVTFIYPPGTLHVVSTHPSVASFRHIRPSVGCFFTSPSPIRRLLLYVTFAC